MYGSRQSLAIRLHRGVTAVLLASLASLVPVRWAGAAPPREVVGLPEIELEAAAFAASPAGFENAARTEDGRIQVMVELVDPPAAVVFADAMQGAAPSDKRALQLAGSLAQAQVARIESAQEIAAAAISGPRIQGRELFRVQKALNGIAVAVAPGALRALQGVPGVKRVLPILPETPTNSTSVPFIGTPNVWANTIGLPAGANGSGVRIGIIDTGIDYQHAGFGGSGLLADYTANNRTVAPDAFFPSAKVVGGFDFAGDFYTGSNAPAPDPDPMDCNGHGSHVSGSAAGFGVTAAGATFTGPFDANPATYSALRIGPGTAPGALLYALRVFGCGGSTGLTTLAIDWAMDPNGDSDLSDHLDVINMSLGSNFGSVLNASSVASDNAALAGVIVVASAGNAGDTFFISGSPGAASRAIATANSVDAGQGAFVTVNAPASIAGNYLAGTASFGPAPSGQTADAVIGLDPSDGAGPLTTDACSPLTNAAAVAGNLCVVDRGSCNFNVKAQNCQAAGAIGMIVADNTFGSPPPPLGGTDPTITIPAVRVTLLDGTAIKNTIISSPPVNITMFGGAAGDTLSTSSSRGPRRIFGSPLRLKPDIAAPGSSITSVQTGITCTGSAPSTGCQVANASGFIADSQPLILSGTSMASPHVAGVMALLRQLHPDWSVEELKALAMNYAVNDLTLFPGGAPPRFGPSRIGAGRVDPAKAAAGEVVAMNAEDVGLVSVTFEPEVVGVVTRTKKVRVVNKGTTAQTFDLGVDTVVDSPGVSISLPGGSSITVGAGQTEELDVQMSADASQMDHTRDPALLPTQGIQANYGDQPRNFLTEEGAYVTFSQGGNLKFRLPVYMAEKPAAMMAAADSIVTGGAGTGSTTIPLSGMDLCTGTLGAGPSCTGSFPPDVESLVSPFELQVVSGVDPVNSTDYADIQYVGVSFLPGPGSPSLTNDLILFGIASWGDWSTLNDVAYNICIDNNEDGVYDRNIINTVPSIFVANAPFNDNFVRVSQNLSTAGFSILGTGSLVNLVDPRLVDTGLHLNNVMILGATPSLLGMASTADTTFRYKVVTCPASNPACARTTTGDRCSPSSAVRFDQAAGPFFYNWAAPGLDFGGNFLDDDLNGASLPVSWNTANMATNGSVGALLLHHHNARGKRAEVVLLDTAQSANLAIAKSVDLATPNIGQNVTFTITVTNNGPDAASGVVVNDFLPSGLTYVSDDGAGAYVPGTGLWTVGALGVSASATLNVVATVDQSGQICNEAAITSGTPLDPSPVDNQAAVCINAPRTADLLIGISASTPTVLVGAPVTFTVTVTNNGNDPAYGLNTNEIFSPLLVPAGSYSGITASQGVFTPATGLWNLASLPTGASATLQYTIAAPNMAGTLTNSVATVSTKSLPAAKAFDPNTGDNSASVAVQVLSPASVTATKTVTGSFVEGGTVTYTIALANSSGFDQQNNTGPELTDVLPSQLTLASASATAGTAVATIATNTVTWDGVVPAGGSVTITIQATINAGTALQTVSNQANVNYDQDGNGLNEAAALSDDPGVAGAGNATSFVVISPASIGVHTKTVSGNFQPGGSVVYTVTISNPSASGQLDNPGNEFTDVLPPQLTLVSASASTGTAVATVATNTVTWNGAILAGGSVTITINATILPSVTLGTVVSNQGTVNFDADGNGTNESSLLTDDPGTPAVDDPSAFTIVPLNVPTLSEVGLVILALLLASGALWVLRRRRA